MTNDTSLQNPKPVVSEANLSKIQNHTLPGDVVLLLSQDRKPFIFVLKPGAHMHTHRGGIAHDDLIGQPWGQPVASHLGAKFTLLRPSTDDLVRHIKRNSQIVYPKDAGYALMRMGVRSGYRVIEAGAGSGAMALMLAQAVMPEGQVYSYDNRPDMLALARENLARVGLERYVTFNLRDVGEGFDESGVDALFYDLPTPWRYLEQAATALIGGGFFACILPTTNQVSQLLYAMEQAPFAMVEVEELILRPYKAVPARLRPMDRITGHTGFLIFARKMVE